MYNFDPPEDMPALSKTLDKVGAIMLFREATGCTLHYSKHVVEKNLGEAPYEVKAIGNLIRGYYVAR